MHNHLSNFYGYLSWPAMSLFHNFFVTDPLYSTSLQSDTWSTGKSKKTVPYDRAINFRKSTDYITSAKARLQSPACH